MSISTWEGMCVLSLSTWACPDAGRLLCPSRTSVLPSTGWMFWLITSQDWTLWSRSGKLLRSLIIPVYVSGPWVRVQGLAICRCKGTCPGNLAKPQDFALKQLPKAHTLCSILSWMGYSVWQAGGNKQLEELAASALLSEHVSEPWIHLSIKPLIGKCNLENYISEWDPVRNRWTCRYGVEWNQNKKIKVLLKGPMVLKAIKITPINYESWNWPISLSSLTCKVEPILNKENHQ